MGPDQPAAKMTGRETVRSFGGLWTIGDGKGDAPDGSCDSIMTLGYDPQTKRFVGTFVASAMTHLWLYNGTLDAAGKVLTLDSEGPSFAGDGTMAKYQDIIEFIADGRRSAIATLRQIDSLSFRDGVVVVADGSSVRTIALDGTVESFADEVGNGLLGLTIGSNGPIVAVYSGRHVVELASGEARRLLLTTEPPWAPTDGTYRDGAVCVVEYAEHPCCWKGPRVRRIVAGEMPTTLLTIDDQDHTHPSPWLRLALWIAAAGLLAATLFWIARAVRRRISQTSHLRVIA